MAFCVAANNITGARLCVTTAEAGKLNSRYVVKIPTRLLSCWDSQSRTHHRPLFCVCINFSLALPEDCRAVLCPRHPPSENWIGVGPSLCLMCCHYLPRSLYAESADGVTYITDATACDALSRPRISHIIYCMSRPIARRTDKARAAPGGRAWCGAGRGARQRQGSRRKRGGGTRE